MPQHYPFSAVLGCDPSDPAGLDDMGLALVLTTVSPEIGGVLVRGQKGTAKSTAVRALAAVLPPIEVVAGDRFSTDPADPHSPSPDGPFGADAPIESRPVRLVELPVGASEDRVLGSLHLERALADGAVEFEPGLLARAHRGILYVDEVNLLHDHLVDLLLDAAAMGRATIERDGVSVEHASRFVLIGTMNPEEGELRPQLLDRFGLTAEVAAPRDPVLRAEVVRRRIAFDADPTGFARRHREAEQLLTERIAAARALVSGVQLSEAALVKVAEVCAAFEVDGLRADIVTARTAVAHAAWQGRDSVTLDDIRRAARLALPHRRRRNPFDAPGLDEDLLEEVLGDQEVSEDPEPEPDPPGPGEDPGPGSDEGDAAPQEDPANEGPDASGPPEQSPEQSPDESPEQGRPTAPLTRSTAAAPYQPRLLALRGRGAGTAGRRSRAVTDSGRRIGSAPSLTASGSVHLVETVRAAAPHQVSRGRTAGPLRLTAADLRSAVLEGRETNLVIFCVDASGSMAARKRMAQVKTAILSLLLDAYRRRDRVGLVTFRGQGAEVALPPTRSVDIAAVRLDALPAGGRTPLAEGLLEAARVVELERRRDPQLRPLLVLVTDGRATGGTDAVARSRRAADEVARLGIGCVVIDCEAGPLRLGLAGVIAARLRAERLTVAEVSAQTLTDAVRERVA